MSAQECPSHPCPTPDQAKGCYDCQCEFCPNPDKRREAKA